jgi:hypothetical protein
LQRRYVRRQRDFAFGVAALLAHPRDADTLALLQAADEFEMLVRRNGLQRRADGFQVAHETGDSDLLARLHEVAAEQQKRHALRSDESNQDDQRGPRQQ